MFKNLIRIAASLFFICLSTSYSQITKPESDANKHDYQIVVDAGSTGTRLHIFKINTSNSKRTIPLIEEIFSSQSNTGIATHINSQRAINEHLAYVLNPAQKFCFQSKIPCGNAPFHFLATGGVRILKPSQQKALFNYVQVWLEDNSIFMNISENRTLTGNEEAELGWLTSFESELRNNKPLGAYFELGGASMQYAYFTKESNEADIKYQIKNKNIYLKVGSWLGFGINEAGTRVTNYWHISQSVCFPKGASKDSNFNYPKCFSLFQNYLEVNQNFESHKAMIEKLVAQNAPIKLGASFAYMISDGFKVNQPGKFQEKLKSICNKSWYDIRTSYIDLVSYHQTSLCAHGTFILNLFSSLGLPKNYSNYSFNTLSWSRGVIIKNWLTQK
ncbi:MAG: hypothetical protein P8L77_03455 [Gammaproteobacteria bacterium]|nr:hypothetical protein [Gammaproteobacteria bacterium]